jgi:hypothetical protein
MPGFCVPFGYYPLNRDIAAGEISLAALPGLKETVDRIERSETIVDSWLYPFPKGRPGRIFGLPNTHVITHENADGIEHLDFLVWCLSFFVGMRLTTTEAGFLDATPLKPGALTDFSMSNKSLGAGISLAESFWQQHRGSQRDIKRIVGIIHTLFLSQYPPYLQFEEFTYLYTALDACYALVESIYGPPAKKPTHAARLDWICQIMGLPIPKWAATDGTKSTELSAVRNPTLHEALFFEEPLGFATYGGNQPSDENVPLEMQALVCRLLVALLGKPDCEYVTSPVNTRQIFGLELS